MRYLAEEMTRGEDSPSPGAWTVTTRDLVLYLVLGVLAGVLRALWVNARGLWFDEAFSVYIAQLPWAEALRQLRVFDPHPPLYYMLLRAWIRLGADPVTVRSLSLLCGVAVSVISMLFAHRLGGRRLGTSVGLLVAGSAFAIQASIEARMYPLLSLFVIAGTWLLVEAIRKPTRWPLWAGYAGTMGAALYTDYFALLTVGGHVFYVAFVHWRSVAIRRGFMMAVGFAFLLFAPWVGVTAEQIALGRYMTPFKGPMPSTAPVNILALNSFGGYLLGLGGYLFGPATRTPWQWVLVFPFAALAVLGVWGARQRERVLVLLAWFVPVAALIIASRVTGAWYAIPRYTSFVYPFYATLTAWGILRLVERVSRSVLVGALVVAVIVLTNLAVLEASSADDQFRVFDWEAAARYVEQQWRSGDVFVFFPAPGRVSFGYYFRRPMGKAITLWTPWIQRRSREEWARTVPPVSTMLGDAPRVWLVVTQPVVPESLSVLTERIRERYRRVEVRDFQYVWVVRYERIVSQDEERPGEKP